MGCISWNRRLGRVRSRGRVAEVVLEQMSRGPDRPNTAERILDGEQFRVQFLGDVTALDRLATLTSELSMRAPKAASTHLVATRVASILHRFTDAKTHLAEAEACGASTSITGRTLLGIKQASGEDLAEVLVFPSSRVAILRCNANLRKSCLLRINPMRQTLRAFELAYSAANRTGNDCFSRDVLIQAAAQLGHTKAFRLSSLHAHQK